MQQQPTAGAEADVMAACVRTASYVSCTSQFYLVMHQLCMCYDSMLYLYACQHGISLAVSQAHYGTALVFGTC
jgi:hypothetical protein